MASLVGGCLPSSARQTGVGTRDPQGGRGLEKRGNYADWLAPSPVKTPLTILGLKWRGAPSKSHLEHVPRGQ